MSEAVEAGNASKVKITVMRQNTPDVVYEIKPTTELGRVMFDYCQINGVNYKEFRFTFLGKKVSDFDTPLILEMGNEDVLDCWAEQTGGASV